MSLSKNSELYKLIKAAVLEAMKTIDKPVKDGSFRMPKGNLKLLKKLVGQGKSDYQIQKAFLERFAYSGCTDRNFVIRYVETARSLLDKPRKTG